MCAWLCGVTLVFSTPSNTTGLFFKYILQVIVMFGGGDNWSVGGSAVPNRLSLSDACEGRGRSTWSLYFVPVQRVLGPLCSDFFSTTYRAGRVYRLCYSSTPHHAACDRAAKTKTGFRLVLQYQCPSSELWNSSDCKDGSLIWCPFIQTLFFLFFIIGCKVSLCEEMLTRTKQNLWPILISSHVVGGTCW